MRTSQSPRDARSASKNLKSFAQSRVFTSVTYLQAAGRVETRFRLSVATYLPGSLPLNLQMQTLEQIN